jgi:hypothetical protein
MRDKYATQSELEAGKISDKLEDDTAGVVATDPHGIVGKERQCPKSRNI